MNFLCYSWLLSNQEQFIIKEGYNLSKYGKLKKSLIGYFKARYIKKCHVRGSATFETLNLTHV